MSGDMNIGTLVAGMKLDTSGIESGISGVAGTLDVLKDSVGKVGASLSALMANPVALAAAAVAALVGLGKAAYDAYLEIDTAYDAIEVGTGAVGESLDGLCESFDAVFAEATYVESAEALAQTMADLNTYLGVTGPELEGLATQLSNLQGIGMDVSVDSLAKAFNRWGVETEDMGGYLDYFFQLSQNTGISIDSLADALTQSQATLDTFGFSLEESAELLALMNKGGFETSELSTALKQLTASGVTTREGFDALIMSIKEAETQEEALTIASEAFGMRTKDAMVELIQSGVFDELTANIEDSVGAINQTADSTADLPDVLDRLGRELTLFGSKVGGVIAVLLDKMIDFSMWWRSLWEKFMPVVEEFAGKLQATFDKLWGDGTDNTQNAIDVIVASVERLFDTMVIVLDWFLETCYPAIELILTTIIASVKLFADVIAGDWDSAFKRIESTTKTVIDAVGKLLDFAWESIKYALKTFLEKHVVAPIVETFNNVREKIETFISGITSGVSSAMQRIANAISSIIDAIVAIAALVVGALVGMRDNIIITLEGIVAAILKPMEEIKEKVCSIWDTICDTVLGFVEDITKGVASGLAGFLNPLITEVNNFITLINQAISALNTLMGLEIPEIPEIPDIGEEDGGGYKPFLTPIDNQVIQGIPNYSIPNYSGGGGSSTSNSSSGNSGGGGSTSSGGLSGILDSISSTASNVWNSVTTTAGNIASGIGNAIGSLFGRGSTDSGGSSGSTVTQNIVINGDVNSPSSLNRATNTAAKNLGRGVGYH